MLLHERLQICRVAGAGVYQVMQQKLCFPKLQSSTPTSETAILALPIANSIMNNRCPLKEMLDERVNLLNEDMKIQGAWSQVKNNSEGLSIGGPPKQRIVQLFGLTG